ncbi:MAG TPA: type II toxin-antitoxin system VapC family toxin [Rhizomicrobium sp.]
MIVVDASIAVKWFIPESDSEAARALYREQLLAPAIWLSEVANVLWHHMQAGKLTETKAKRLLWSFRRAPITSIAADDHLEQALSLANEVQHAIYDCLYLALAVEEGTYLITADARFVRAVRRHRKWTRYIRLLGEH